ncbi:MAG: hypothetical protein J6W00_07140 [Lentisphaeria bacterium]|nr:hypothetical protein [Lentisphaeria bacterium]
MAERVPNHLFDRYMQSARKFEEKWRRDNQQCFEYVDGDQWSEDEIYTIENRGQQPTVINTILPTIDMVCAVASQQQADIQVVGREGSDDEKATLLTALLKHTIDSCHYDYQEKEAMRECYIGGRSWFEVGIFTDERGKDLVKVDHVPWENVYCDPFSRKPDASDARFIIKVKWVDRDVLKELYPDASEMVDTVFEDDYEGQEYEAQTHSSGRSEFYWDVKSNRVRVCECYYTMPEYKKIKILDEETGKETEKEILKSVLHYVVFADEVILAGSATNHKVNTPPVDIDIYPLVPMYCRRDRKGRPMGIVRNLIDLQDQINKLNSKFLWTLMSNRMVMEEGAVQDPAEAREEFQKPDGLVMLLPGGLNKVRIDDKYRDLSYMSNHLNFLLATEQRISGVNDSMLGLGGTNERSGIMQSTRISQGASMQTSILENMFFSRERVSFVILKLIGAYYTDYRVMTITQPNGTTDRYEFNKREVTVNPFSGDQSVRILNQIEKTLYYDCILKRVPMFNSIRERQLQIFSEVFKTGVIPAEIAGEIMLLLSDLPNRQDILMRLQNVYQQQAMQQQAMVESAAMQAGQSPA